ncbi:MAG: 30S ribosome-binding factor RbfA [Candidatus Bipolaricaulota bacterium]|nr:30S ribosome-binding factor RbfA [Candidatus Bipolaricaulota bacterium]
MSNERLREKMKRQLSTILEFEVRDPVIKRSLSTVTEVKLSRDARYARVYIAVGEAGEDRAAVLKVFNRDSGFFRSKLAARLQVRYTPELRFILDETFDKARRMEQLLQTEQDEISSD